MGNFSIAPECCCKDLELSFFQTLLRLLRHVGTTDFARSEQYEAFTLTDRHREDFFRDGATLLKGLLDLSWDLIFQYNSDWWIHYLGGINLEDFIYFLLNPLRQSKVFWSPNLWRNFTSMLQQFPTGMPGILGIFGWLRMRFWTSTSSDP